jgi:1L-myo-inositol 1-phosphate cytidylyltransferase
MTSRDHPVSTAVVLMAGMGSRLRSTTGLLPKPLFPLLGKPLVTYTLEALVRNGLTDVHAITGYESEAITEAVSEFAPSGVKLNFILNQEWKKQNGISVLAAAPFVTGEFLLMMSDHLFDDALIRKLIEGPEADCLNLAIDRKIDSIFDLDDAMKVKTDGAKIRAIGKHLTDFDAVDTGLFRCSSRFFDYLERAKINGDCSLADGVRLAAEEDKARVIDIGNLWWQDVDTPEMFAEAERRLADSLGDRELGRAGHGDSREEKTAQAHREP